MFFSVKQKAAAILATAALIMTACSESEPIKPPQDAEKDKASEQIRLALRNHPDFHVFKTTYGDYLGCPSSGFGPSVVHLKSSGSVYTMNGIARGNYKNLPNYEGEHLSEYLSACSSSPEEMEQHPVIVKASSEQSDQPSEQVKLAIATPVATDEDMEKAKELIPPGTKHEQLVLDEVSKGYITPKEIEIYLFMKNRFENYIEKDGKYDIDKHDPLVYKDAEAAFGLPMEKTSDIYWRADNVFGGRKPKESILLDSKNIPVEISVDRIELTPKKELEVTVSNQTKITGTLPNINLTFDLYKNGKKVGFEIVWLEELGTGKKMYTSLPIRHDFDTVEGRLYMNVDEMKKRGLRSNIEIGNKRGDPVVQLLQLKPFNVLTSKEVVLPREEAIPVQVTAEEKKPIESSKTAERTKPAESAKPAVTPKPSEHPQVPVLPEGVLKPGSSGAKVKQLQEALLLVGEQLPVSGADSFYGKETVEAIKSVQTKMQKKADGIYGEETRKALLALLIAGKAQAR